MLNPHCLRQNPTMSWIAMSRLRRKKQDIYKMRSMRSNVSLSSGRVGGDATHQNPCNMWIKALESNGTYIYIITIIIIIIIIMKYFYDYYYY